MIRANTSLDHKRVRRLIWLVLTFFVLLGYSLQSVAGNAYYSMVMQAYGTVTLPPVILEEGNCSGTSTIYTNNTSAKVSTAAPAPTPAYYPNSYNVATGTYLSGNVPASVETVDTNYFIVRSSGTATSTTAYNPSNYSLLGSTTLLSGAVENLASGNDIYMTFRSYSSGTATSYNPSNYTLWGSTTLAGGTVSNLTSDDSSYMVFNSYPSAFSTTSNSRAAIGYRSNTTSGTSSPKSRTWNGTAWSLENELTTAGSPVRWVRTAYCPISTRYNEYITVTLSDDGNLDAYVWTGSTWQVTNNTGSVGTTANAYRAFDVQYEKTNGRALLVYSTGGGTVDMQYKIWNGTAWSNANDLDLTATASGTNVYWITLAQKPISGANEIALICIEGTNSYVYAKIWNGSTWGNEKTLTSKGVAVLKEVATIVYEQVSGYAEAIVARSNQDEFSVRWNGSAWDTNVDTDFAGSAVVNWLTAKADPVSNKILVTAVDSSIRLYTQYWDGSAWAANAVQQDGLIDTTNGRCADFAWEPTGSKGLLVWGTTAGKITYKKFTAPSTWDATATEVTMGTNKHYWVQLRRNPRSVSGDIKILGAVLEDVAYDLGAIKWDGTTFTVIDSGTFSTEVTSSSYECFDLKFQEFGDPSEYTSEVEFTGTSNAALWTEVTWKVDSACSAGSANVTLQLYNWNASSYPSSGDGYISYTSSAIPNTDETQNQTITVNPAYFRENGSGNWKVKVKNVKSTNTSFQCKIDWVQVRPGLEQYTSEVAFSGSANTYTWTQLVWSVDSAWTVGSVTVTIQVYNYTLGGYPPSGNGYDSYTSNSTANSDQTRTQTITTNPQDFRNDTGNWKIKILGVKNTNTQFDFKADWIEFKPTYYSEYTVSTEFIFSNMTKNVPTQLNFTVVSEYDIANVSVTIQIWNYSSSKYVTGGEGYLTYTSAGANVTKVLNITTNPQFYTSSGYAKINVTGVNSTTTEFQQKINQIKLTYEYNASSTYDYVLKVVNQVTYNWTVNLRVYDNSSIGRLSSLNISLHDGTSSNQIVVSGGSIIKSEGEPYNLPEGLGSTLYISMSNLQATTTDTSYLYVYLKIRVPNTSTYSLYVIIFEIN